MHQLLLSNTCLLSTCWAFASALVFKWPLLSQSSWINSVSDCTSVYLIFLLMWNNGNVYVTSLITVHPWLISSFFNLPLLLTYLSVHIGLFSVSRHVVCLLLICFIMPPRRTITISEEEFCDTISKAVEASIRTSKELFYKKLEEQQKQMDDLERRVK